jgi:hypothetical protein
MTKSAITILFITFMIALTGCVTADMGKVPRTDKLPELIVGVTTDKQIKSILGNPSGKGMSQMPGYSDRRTVWSYHHSIASNSSSDSNTLLVFIKGNLYDGYLWSSSFEERK